MSININCSEKFVSTFLRFDSHFTVGTSWGRGWPHARQSGRSLSHTVQTQHTVAFLLPVGLASRKHPTQTPLPHRLSPPRTPFPKSRRSHKELFKEEQFSYKWPPLHKLQSRHFLLLQVMRVWKKKLPVGLFIQNCWDGLSSWPCKSHGLRRGSRTAAVFRTSAKLNN